MTTPSDDGDSIREDSLNSPGMVFDPMTIAIAILTAAGSKVAGSGAESASAAISSYIKGNGPVACAVVASWSVDGTGHHIALQFQNLTPHGAYVEEIWTSDPKNFDFKVVIATGRHSIGVQTERPKESVIIPVYVPSFGKADIVLRLIDNVDQNLGKRNVVELTYRYSVAGGKEVDYDDRNLEKRVKIRLRKTGPSLPPQQ